MNVQRRKDEDKGESRAETEKKPQRGAGAVRTKVAGIVANLREYTTLIRRSVREESKERG